MAGRRSRSDDRRRSSSPPRRRQQQQQQQQEEEDDHVLLSRHAQQRRKCRTGNKADPHRPAAADGGGAPSAGRDDRGAAARSSSGGMRTRSGGRAAAVPTGARSADVRGNGALATERVSLRGAAPHRRVKKTTEDDAPSSTSEDSDSDYEMSEEEDTEEDTEEEEEEEEEDTEEEEDDDTEYDDDDDDDTEEEEEEEEEDESSISISSSEGGQIGVAAATVLRRRRTAPSKKRQKIAHAPAIDEETWRELEDQMEARFWGRFYVAGDAAVVPADDTEMDAEREAAAAGDVNIAEGIRTYRRAALERWRGLDALRRGVLPSPRRRAPAGHQANCQMLRKRIAALTRSQLLYCIGLYIQRVAAATTREEAAVAGVLAGSAAAAAEEDDDEEEEEALLAPPAAGPLMLEAELEHLVLHYSMEQILATTRELEAVSGHFSLNKPYRLLLAEMPTTLANKAEILHTVERLESMDSSASEYPQTKHWVDGAFRLPFGRHSGVNLRDLQSLAAATAATAATDPGAPLPVAAPPLLPAPAPAGAALLLHRAWGALEESTYGMLPAKIQILQTLARWVAQPPGSISGGALAFHGPPGTGKTSLARRGLCAALGRAFAFIPLGGASHAEFLDGFASTYQGATWGRIAQSLMECRCMNPVLYFDELDKVANTEHGKEVEQVLVHITDSAQNSEFCDKFFHGVRLSLAQCLMVFSYNDESRVSSILRDRLTVIHLPGYSVAEKLEIARLHLVPDCLAAYGFAAGDVVFGPEVLRHMINLGPPEDGVRSLKRAIDAVVGKLNLRRMLLAADALALNAREPSACPREITQLPHHVQVADLSSALCDGGSGGARNAAWRAMFT